MIWKVWAFPSGTPRACSSLLSSSPSILDWNRYVPLSVFLSWRLPAFWLQLYFWTFQSWFQCQITVQLHLGSQRMLLHGNLEQHVYCNVAVLHWCTIAWLFVCFCTLEGEEYQKQLHKHCNPFKGCMSKCTVKSFHNYPRVPPSWILHSLFCKGY